MVIRSTATANFGMIVSSRKIVDMLEKLLQNSENLWSKALENFSKHAQCTLHIPSYEHFACATPRLALESYNSPLSDPM